MPTMTVPPPFIRGRSVRIFKKQRLSVGVLGGLFLIASGPAQSFDLTEAAGAAGEYQWAYEELYALKKSQCGYLVGAIPDADTVLQDTILWYAPDEASVLK